MALINKSSFWCFPEHVLQMRHNWIVFKIYLKEIIIPNVYDELCFNLYQTRFSKWDS